MKNLSTKRVRSDWHFLSIVKARELRTLWCHFKSLGYRGLSSIRKEFKRVTIQRKTSKKLNFIRNKIYLNFFFFAIRSDEGLMLETSTMKLFTVANLSYQPQLIIPNYPVILSHRHSTTVSLETYPLYSEQLVILFWLLLCTGWFWFHSLWKNSWLNV